MKNIILTFEYALISLYRITKKIYPKNHSPVFYAHMVIWGIIMLGFLLPFFMIVDARFYDYSLNKSHWMILAVLFLGIWYFTVEKRYNTEKAERLLRNYDYSKYSKSKYLITFVFLLIAFIYVFIWFYIRPFEGYGVGI